mgnify:CR=1 FL=1
MMNQDKLPELSAKTPKRKSKRRIRKRRVVLGILVVAAAAFGTLAALNRDVDPTEWKGVRSGYENTK